MKVITEAIIRAELKATKPDVYYIPEGKLLSPAAREYLNQMQVDIDFERNRGAHEEAEKKPAAVAASRPAPAQQSAQAGAAPAAEGIKAKYVDFETGAGYVQTRDAFRFWHLFIRNSKKREEESRKAMLRQLQQEGVANGSAPEPARKGGE